MTNQLYFNLLVRNLLFTNYRQQNITLYFRVTTTASFRHYHFFHILKCEQHCIVLLKITHCHKYCKQFLYEKNDNSLVLFSIVCQTMINETNIFGYAAHRTLMHVIFILSRRRLRSSVISNAELHI